MEYIIQLENEAAAALRAHGEVVYADAALNVAIAFDRDLLGPTEANAARYCIEQSLAAGRTITENLGATVCRPSIDMALAM